MDTEYCLNTILFHALCHGQGLHIPLDRLLKTPSSLTLTTSRDGASTASPGNLFWHLTTFIIENFSLVSNFNVPSFNLKPFSITICPCKMSFYDLSVGPFIYWEPALKPPRAFSSWNPPNTFRLASSEVLLPSDLYDFPLESLVKKQILLLGPV